MGGSRTAAVRIRSVETETALAALVKVHPHLPASTFAELQVVAAQLHKVNARLAGLLGVVANRRDVGEAIYREKRARQKTDIRGPTA